MGSETPAPDSGLGLWEALHGDGWIEESCLPEAGCEMSSLAAFQAFIPHQVLCAEHQGQAPEETNIRCAPALQGPTI